MKNSIIQLELIINKNVTDIVRRETHERQSFSVDVDGGKSRGGMPGKRVGHSETFLRVGLDNNEEAIYELFVSLSTHLLQETNEWLIFLVTSDAMQMAHYKLIIIITIINIAAWIIFAFVSAKDVI